VEHEEAAGRRLGILTIPTRTARADRRWIWSNDFQELVKETMRRRLTVLELSEEDITRTPGMDEGRLAVRDLVGLYGLSRRGRRSRWRSRAGVGRRAPEGGRVPTLMPEADTGGRFETEGGAALDALAMQAPHGCGVCDRRGATPTEHSAESTHCNCQVRGARRIRGRGGGHPNDGRRRYGAEGTARRARGDAEGQGT
jgi:hypothetical protein